MKNQVLKNTSGTEESFFPAEENFSDAPGCSCKNELWDSRRFRPGNPLSLPRRELWDSIGNPRSNRFKRSDRTSERKSASSAMKGSV